MFSTGRGLHVFEGNGLNPPCGPINDSKEIHVAFLRRQERTHKIHVDVGESLAGSRELLKRRCRLLSHVGTFDNPGTMHSCL
jgi:hypothetical protein